MSHKYARLIAIYQLPATWNGNRQPYQINLDHHGISIWIRAGDTLADTTMNNVPPAKLGDPIGIKDLPYWLECMIEELVRFRSDLTAMQIEHSAKLTQILEQSVHEFLDKGGDASQILGNRVPIKLH
jgi:hypothetical protein